MKSIEFESVPCINTLLRATRGLSGRFVIENAYSGLAIVGAEPTTVISSKNGFSTIYEGGSTKLWHGCPFELLRATFRKFCNSQPLSQLTGGIVGYFSYDLGRHIETLPCVACEDIPSPDYMLGVYDSGLVIDFQRGKCVAFSHTEDHTAIRFWQDLALNTQHQSKTSSNHIRRLHALPENIASNFTKPNYINAIRRVQEYIAAGDVYQVNLSQRLQAECPCPADELYVRLRAINPAPRACLIELGDVQLVGASPESFLSYNPATRIIQTKPIKGTRPRGKSREEDIHLASELASSEKDRAENVMIVDMERNDLGKVASYGSVQVTKLWDIEEHPNVFQMVSTVEATLDPAYDVVDLLRATFPGGSITGAPKVRAMQIIEELEPHRRGLYTGAAGYIGFDGSIELNIIIRSFVIYDGIAYFHAGGGIVADSNPEMEYQETLDKVAGLVAAITGQVS